MPCGTNSTAIPGLEVIGSTSSRQYNQTAKGSKQIGQELGVRFLLLGKVRWAKDGSASRVQVRPELIEAASGAERWGESFDAALTDVFQVQAAIAGRVARALNVALGDSVQHQLAERPTQSLPAYEAFLRGEETWRDLSHRAAIANYEQAVALDTAFFQAWAQLARAQATRPARTPAQADASRRAAERALALAPEPTRGPHCASRIL